MCVHATQSHPYHVNYGPCTGLTLYGAEIRVSYIRIYVESRSGILSPTDVCAKHRFKTVRTRGPTHLRLILYDLLHVWSRVIETTFGGRFLKKSWSRCRVPGRTPVSKTIETLQVNLVLYTVGTENNIPISLTLLRSKQK